MRTEVDDHIRRLWRHRGTTVPGPRRGPRQQLDLDEILDAAIALADAEGLAAVSTRAVAARFGKTAMALYPYVGTKENLLALMQDHACALPEWADPPTGLADGLQAWAGALFDLYLRHPWLTERSWSQASQGPNERDWLERLLRILDTWTAAQGKAPVKAPGTAPGKAPGSAPGTAPVTMLYATVRACAETAAAYRRIDRDGAAEWLARAESTRDQIPDLHDRYPLSAALTPVAADWRDAPRAGLTQGVGLLAAAIEAQVAAAARTSSKSGSATGRP